MKKLQDDLREANLDHWYAKPASKLDEAKKYKIPIIEETIVNIGQRMT